jgi:general secretion pathway protein L
MERASPSLRKRLHSAAQQSGLLAFWQWWLRELAPIVPVGLRTALRRRRLRSIIVLERDAAVLWAPHLADGALAFAEVARVPLLGDPADVAMGGRAAIEALPRAAFDGVVAETRVAVSLPASQVLRKTITLPAAVEENLLQTLAYDLDRHTPFKPDEVYFDARVVGRDPAKKEIRVDWAAALKAVVDQARRTVEPWGAVVAAVTPESPTGAAALAGRSLNLLPAAERPDESIWRRRQIWVPLALIAIVAIVAIVLPLWQKRGYAIELAKLADQTRVQADASSALREELDRLTGDYNFALQRKYAFPPAMQVLEDVTKILPDDTWLTQFELKTTARGKEPHREIVLRGESANAGSLISLLEESKVFEQAAPRSPTTKIQPGPGEIFDLGAQLKPLPLPQPILLSAVDRAAPAPSRRAPVQAQPATPAEMPVLAAPPKSGEPVAAPAAQAQPAAPAETRVLAAPAKSGEPVAAPAAPAKSGVPFVTSAPPVRGAMMPPTSARPTAPAAPPGTNAVQSTVPPPAAGTPPEPEATEVDVPSGAPPPPPPGEPPGGAPRVQADPAARATP